MKNFNQSVNQSIDQLHLRSLFANEFASCGIAQIVYHLFHTYGEFSKTILINTHTHLKIEKF